MVMSGGEGVPLEILEAKVTELETQCHAIESGLENAQSSDLSEITAALEGLNNVKREDLDKLKSSKKAPAAALKVLEGVCIVRAIKPEVGYHLGRKVANYWEPSKKIILSDPDFAKTLREVERDKITEESMTQLSNLVDAAGFVDDAKRVSAVAGALAVWLKSIVDHNRTQKEAEPMKAALDEKQSELKKTQEELGTKSAEEHTESGENAPTEKFRSVRSSTESLASVKSSTKRALRKSQSEGALQPEDERNISMPVRSSRDGFVPVRNANSKAVRGSKEGKSASRDGSRSSSRDETRPSPPIKPSHPPSKSASPPLKQPTISDSPTLKPELPPERPAPQHHYQSVSELSLPSVGSSVASVAALRLPDLQVEGELGSVLRRCDLLEELASPLAQHGLTRVADLEALILDSEEFDDVVLDVSRTTKMAKSKVTKKLRILLRELESGNDRTKGPSVRDSVDQKEEELAACLEKLFQQQQKEATDPSFNAFMKKKDSDGHNVGRLLHLLKVWVGWREKQPGPVDAMPGVGRSVPGQYEVHPYLGAERPKIEVTHVAEAGWHEMLLKHARHAAMRNLSDHLDRVGRLAADKLESGMRQISTHLHARTESAKLLLENWPRGNGAGELLLEPLFDKARVSERGVKVDWWLAVVNRAPFVGTRTFVEAFVKPVTKRAACALYYYIPPRFRAKPQVYMSHAWDGSLWDLRPPSDANALWLDALALHQHEASSDEAKLEGGGGGGGGEGGWERVTGIGQVVASIGRTCLVVPGDKPLLPFTRSWCLYEIAHTKQENLELRLGWSTWSKSDLENLRLKVEQCDIEEAGASNQEDKAVIEKQLVGKFGTAKAASFALQDAIIKGFAHEAMQAFVDTDQPDAEEQMARMEERGRRAHFELEMVRVWGEEPIKVVTAFGTTWDVESKLGVGKRVQFAPRLEYSRERRRGQEGERQAMAVVEEEGRGRREVRQRVPAGRAPAEGKPKKKKPCFPSISARPSNP